MVLSTKKKDINIYDFLASFEIDFIEFSSSLILEYGY